MSDLLPLLGKQVWIQAGQIVLHGVLGLGWRYAVEDKMTDGVYHIIRFEAYCVKALGEMNGEPLITLDVPL